MSAIACKRSPKITPIFRGLAFAPKYSNSSQKISICKCLTLFALADRLWLRGGVWAEHYRLEAVVKCMNGGGNASHLRQFLVRWSKLLSPSTPTICRGKAFPRLSISFQILLVWECFAQASQCRENLLVKAERVKHLQNDMSVVSLGIVAQMLNPYGCYLYG
jgi:hypothetical protein